MYRLVTAVVFLDSELSEDLTHMLLYARAEIFKTFSIFLLHFRYDEFRFFQKWDQLKTPLSMPKTQIKENTGHILQ